MRRSLSYVPKIIQWHSKQPFNLLMRLPSNCINVIPEGRTPKMSHPVSIANVGGGKVHGLCIPAGLFAQETNLATLSPFLYCLPVPALPHSQSSMNNCLRCSHHFHWSPDYCPWSPKSENGKYRLVEKVKFYLEMRCKSCLR